MIALMLALSAQAGDAGRELQNTSGWFLAGEFAGSVFLGFMGPDLVLKPQPEHLDCSSAWCEPPGIDVALNKAFALDRPRGAGHVSHVFTIGLTPAAVFGASIYGAARSRDGWFAAQDAVIIVDAFMVSTGVNSIAKVAGRRQRPAYYYDREDRTEAAEHPDEEFLSFYSGDTTWAFTLAATGTTLAYLRGYEHARWLAVGSGVLAFTGSFLRMSADMHWFTDVLVGAAVGTAIGAGMPLVLHRPKREDGVAWRVGAGPGDLGLAVSARW